MTMSFIINKLGTFNPARVKFERIKPLSLLAMVVLAGSLSACGGGDETGGSTPPGPATYQTAVTSVPSPSYTVEDSATAVNLLNILRQEVGAGLVAQNTSLDQAASAHASFLIDNALVADDSYLTTEVQGILGGHYEDPALVGYTGQGPLDRTVAAGYTGTVTEIISFGALTGTECLASLEDSVYHLVQLMTPFVDIGVAFNPGVGSGSVCAIELGVPSGTLGQLPANGNTVGYPFAGQTDVQPVYYNQAEAPNPAPDLLMAGHPVVVSLYTQSASTLTGSDIVLHDFSMVSESGASVSARVLANSGLASDGPALTTDDVIAGAGYVVLLPEVTLDPLTLYYVSFAATVKGTEVNKTWSFTTGIVN